MPRPPRITRLRRPILDAQDRAALATVGAAVGLLLAALVLLMIAGVGLGLTIRLFFWAGG